MQRRDLLKAGAALIVAGFPATALLAAGKASDATGLQCRGPLQPFDYAWLKGRARTLSNAAYQAPRNQLPEAVAAIDWDQYQTIKHRDDDALWPQQRLRAKFFPRGMLFKDPVRIYELNDGQAQEIAYDPTIYGSVQGGQLPDDLGFAGFHISTDRDFSRDVVAFLGASYFRAVGGQWQYGLSARGLAVDCGMPYPEEFPVFTAFWLQRPAAGSNRLVLYALLDSPSVAGAYRFEIQPGDTLTMEVDVALYPRQAIARIGIAPLTSMFQYGENDRRAAHDWRPEIHDSDGLAMQRGNGEWIWRPLNNPAQLRLNVYQDENPRGFGLLQRDRNFDHYQDDGVFYERRPSLWVEPKGNWGKGALQLLEIPTEDETFDNIVAFWTPQQTPQAGQELLFAYRLYWGTALPQPATQAQVVATRTGQGGVIGAPRSYFSWRFVIDFSGGTLASLARDANVMAHITASRGTLEITSTRPLAAVQGYRTMFDVRPDASNAPIDLHVYLTADGQLLSETWLYQWTPPLERSF